MRTLDERLAALGTRLAGGRPATVAIFGLGSVGNYLLDYLLDLPEPGVRVAVVGRDPEKLRRDANICRVAGMIRDGRAREVRIEQADFGSPQAVAEAIGRIRPDFIVNSSRAYSGLKYGSLSWKAVRAYGIWSPLSVRYVRTLMRGCELAGTDAVVINTSYSDATHAWLRSAGMRCPDFGSGNLNHLVPRIRMAAAELIGLEPGQAGRIDVTLATAHFHDVAISKEGATEGEEPLLRLELDGREISLDRADLYRRCAIAMPTDQKRNQMNASSNLEIIVKVLRAVGGAGDQKLHVPGFEGLIGGYPVAVTGACTAQIFEKFFTMAEMAEHNRRSLRLDGIESIESGVLRYTPELLDKVRRAFGCELPAEVSLERSEEAASFIIDRVIAPRI